MLGWNNKKKEAKITKVKQLGGGTIVVGVEN
jgi:hypothetical protein